jgi:hypothetical protein
VQHSNLLYIKNNYFKQFGAIQLGSFRAEAILEEISAHLDSLANKIGNTNLSLISNLVGKITYQQFEVNLSLNELLIDDFFENFFSDPDLMQKLKTIYSINRNT